MSIDVDTKLDASKRAYNPSQKIWTVDEVREITYRAFGKRPCWLQIQIGLALYSGKDVVACAATGAGKTLSFWIPLLMSIEDGQKKITFVVTPLNLLGKQNVEGLERMGLKAVAVNRESANTKTFKEIEEGFYNVVIINPELLMNSPEITRLWKNKSFTSRILNFIFDEGHCISQWGKFRKDYQSVGNLRYLVDEDIPFYVASATLPEAVIAEVQDILRLRASNTKYFLRTNDRPDIHLMVRPLTFPANSFRDLGFLIPSGNNGERRTPVQKFLVFFDNTKEAERATRYLQDRLPGPLHAKVRWFHSTMTPEYRAEELDAFRAGKTWGLCTTDAFGMGMDLPDVEVVVQFKATCSLNTLWQRFGRGARGVGCEAFAILLVDKKHTVEARAKAERRSKVQKRKRADTHPQSLPHAKRPILAEKQLRESNKGDSTVDMDVDDGCGTSDEEVPLAEQAEKRKDKITACRRRYAAQERAIVSKANKTWNFKRQQQQLVVEGSALDDYINAHHIFACRREVPRIYFGNDKATMDDHTHCNPLSPSGCLRCAPKKPTICCDLCRPDQFSKFHMKPEARTPVTSTQKPTPIVTKKPLDEAQRHAREKEDVEFKRILFAWRKEQAEKEYGASIVNQMGSRMLMPNAALDRIITCARIGILYDLDALVLETGWRRDLAHEYGATLLTCINERFPQLPRPLNTEDDAIPPRSGRKTSEVQHQAGNSSSIRIITCSACNREGHTRRSRECPEWVKTDAKDRKSKKIKDENVAPVVNSESKTAQPQDVGQPFIQYQAPSHYQWLLHSSAYTYHVPQPPLPPH